MTISVIISCMLFTSIKTYADNDIVNEYITEGIIPNTIVKIQEYKSGFRQESQYAICLNCEGTKVCGSCNGKGGLKIGRNYMPCILCQQTGYCYTCDDDGLALISTFLYAPDGSLVGSSSLADFDTDSNYSSSDSGSKRKSGRGKCSICGGTGINPIGGGGSASWAGYYNSNGTKCPYCGKYTGHMHDRCQECNTPKY